MAVPAGVVTAIFPVVAPAGTVAVILIGVLTVTVVAAVPLNVTVDVPVKLAPLIVTLVPITPLVGVKLVIRGATVKLVPLVAVPPGVVTAIGPVVALPGTCHRDLRAGGVDREGGGDPVELDRGRAAEVRPGDDDGHADRATPGEKLLIAGVRRTVKSVALVAVPAAVVTAMRPVVAPAGTVAVILTCVLVVMAAAVPLNVTDDAPARLAPLMVTLAPTAPVDGVKLVIRGATMKLVALVAVPPGAVVTPIGPVVALAGTVAVICVLEFDDERGVDAVEPDRRDAARSWRPRS